MSQFKDHLCLIGTCFPRHQLGIVIRLSAKGPRITVPTRTKFSFLEIIDNVARPACQALSSLSVLRPTCTSEVGEVVYSLAENKTDISTTW